MTNSDHLFSLKNEGSLLTRAANILSYVAIGILLGGASGVIIVEVNQPTYIVFGLMSIFAFVVAILNVEFGLLVLVFLVYTRLSDILVHNYDLPSMAQWYIALMIGAILARWALFREVPRGWLKPAILIGVYGLICFASLLYASETTNVQDALVVFAKDAIITIVVVILLQKGTSFLRVIWVLIGVGIFLGTISCIQYFTGTFTSEYGGFAIARVMHIVGDVGSYRIGGPIGDPNFFAQIMVVITPMALERLLHERTIIRRGLALWSLLVCVLSILFTYSRGGFLAITVAMAIFFLIYPPRFYQVPFLIISFLAILVFSPPQYIDRIFSLGGLLPSPGSVRMLDSSLSERATLNLVSLEMIKSNPLLGVGLNNYGSVFNEYAKRIGADIGLNYASAHDLYIEVVTETGFFGLTAFMTIVVSSVVLVWKTRKKFLQANLSDYAGMVSGFGVGLIGYLTAAFFIHGAFPRYLFLLIGIAFSLQSVTRDVLHEKG